MGLTLYLGVVDVAYSDASGNGAKTTGDVAEGLENGFGGNDKGYKIMQTFFFLNKEKIAGYLADSMAASLQTMINTGRPIDNRASLTFGADQKIETLFRQFIFSDSMSKLEYAVTGLALSAAAAAGVNHRKKHPYAKANKPRPAFVDTGLYVASFRAWTAKTADAATVGSGT